MTPLFILNGRVVKGKKRGKELGFPTANISIDSSTPTGTYISKTILRGKIYQSITFVGVVETFNEEDFVGETYFLDFDQDLYGEEIIVRILKKLRDNKKFESQEALIRQMREDEIQARKFFAESR